MPVWQRETEKYIADEKVVVLGVIQEQHAERCRLYAQWKNFTFPIVQDAMTSNGLAVVPVVLFIDEHGVVQNRRPKVSQLKAFVKTEFAKPETLAERVPESRTDVIALKAKAEESRRPDDFCVLGDALLNWGGETSSNKAIAAYKRSLIHLKKLKNGTDSIVTEEQLEFRLGVAYRKRFDNSKLDSSQRANDFSFASLHWSTALKKNPNQYIWRRRIEQYGPRLAKPYPFYDWIEDAQKEIAARGETPVQLLVALSGAEIAKPSRTFAADETGAENPDPDAKVTVDQEALVDVKVTCVPAWVEPGKTVRVHLRFAPNKGEWNNEGQPLRVWLSKSEDVQLSSQTAETPNPAAANSSEARTLEFEIKLADTVQDDIEVSGFALYNTCEKESDQCLFRRLEFVVPIKIVKPN